MNQVENPPKAKTERKKRGGGLLEDIAATKKALEALAKKYPFIIQDVEAVQQKNNKSADSARKAFDEHRNEHERVRAKLATEFNGAVERHIRNRGSEETKQFFGRVWGRNY